MSRLFVLLIALLGSATLRAAPPFKGIPDPPTLPVRSYLLMDHASGQVLAESHADVRVEPASLTKIMTVYAVADALKKGLVRLDDRPVISEYAWKQEGSRMFIEVNKQVSVDELLHGDIIQSGNDASVALAEHVSGSEEVFATVMNGHAKRLGMKSSSFANSTGLPDPATFTTARDMATLGRALIGDFPEIYAMFKEPEYTFNGITQRNRNGLLGRDPSVDGIKTGHTEAAGYCLVASAMRDGMRLISVVMGAESDGARTQASQALLNYGFRFFENRQLYAQGATVTTGRVWQGAAQQVDVGMRRDLAVIVPRGAQGDRVTASAELQKPLVAPLEKGQVVGTLVVKHEAQELAREPLVALNAVASGSWFRQAIDAARLLFE
ncbi:MAG: D-alanyl-D-alanine carboxypeptidase family protein [Gammaproteobacteria bacterium]